MRKQSIYDDLERHLAGHPVPDIEAKLEAALARGLRVIVMCHGSKREANRLAEACRPCRLGIHHDMPWVEFSRPRARSAEPK
jgi:hypothetical protein